MLKKPIDRRRLHGAAGLAVLAASPAWAEDMPTVEEVAFDPSIPAMVTTGGPRRHTNRVRGSLATRTCSYRDADRRSHSRAPNDFDASPTLDASIDGGRLAVEPSNSESQPAFRASLLSAMTSARCCASESPASSVTGRWCRFNASPASSRSLAASVQSRPGLPLAQCHS